MLKDPAQDKSHKLYHVGFNLRRFFLLKSHKIVTCSMLAPLLIRCTSSTYHSVLAPHLRISLILCNFV